jgi:predicted DNA-binding WGR domain protein
MSLLQESAYGGDFGLVKMMHEAGMDIDEIDDCGRLALYEAAKEGHLIILDYLLTQGAKVDKFNGSGRTALGVASDFGNSSEIVARLLEAGADPKKANKAGKTPIDLADTANPETAHHPAIKELLAKAAADKKRAAPAATAPAAKKVKTSAEPAAAEFSGGDGFSAHGVCESASGGKFWNVKVSGSEMTTTYGKVGATSGASNTKEFASEEKAVKEAEKLVKQKEKKGYVME